MSFKVLEQNAIMELSEKGGQKGSIGPLATVEDVERSGEQALQAMQMMVASDGSRSLVVKIAHWYRQQGMFAEALGFLDRAIAASRQAWAELDLSWCSDSARYAAPRYPKENAFHRIKGVVHAQMGNLKLAAACFEEAIHVANYPQAAVEDMFMLGRALYDSGERRRAQESMERCIHFAPDQHWAKMCEDGRARVKSGRGWS